MYNHKGYLLSEMDENIASEAKSETLSHEEANERMHRIIKNSALVFNLPTTLIRILLAECKWMEIYLERAIFDSMETKYSVCESLIFASFCFVLSQKISV